MVHVQYVELMLVNTKDMALVETEASLTISLVSIIDQCPKLSIIVQPSQVASVIVIRGILVPVTKKLLSVSLLKRINDINHSHCYGQKRIALC